MPTTSLLSSPRYLNLTPPLQWVIIARVQIMTLFQIESNLIRTKSRPKKTEKSFSSIVFEINDPRRTPKHAMNLIFRKFTKITQLISVECHMQCHIFFKKISLANHSNIYQPCEIHRRNIFFSTILMNLSPFKSRYLQQEVLLKVSKFQKQIFLFSFSPKNERNHFFDFCPSL